LQEEEEWFVSSVMADAIKYEQIDKRHTDLTLFTNNEKN